MQLDPNVRENRRDANGRAIAGTGLRTSASEVHVDIPLTDFAVSYANDQFIADEISPPIYTTFLSGKFFKRQRKDRARVIDDQFGQRGQSNEITYDVTTDTYLEIDRGLHQPVPADVEANANAPLDPRALAVDNVMQHMKLAREVRVANKVMTAANWAAGSTGAVSNLWSNETTGTPVTDLQTALQTLRGTGARQKIIGVCSLPVYHSMAKHPQMMGLRPGGGLSGGLLSTKEIPAFLGFDELYVSKLEKNTANDAQTASYTWVWDNTKFALLVVPEVLQGMDLQIFLATFMLKGGMQVRTWREEKLGRGGSEIVQVEAAIDEHIAMNDRGYLLTSVN